MRLNLQPHANTENTLLYWLDCLTAGASKLGSIPGRVCHFYRPHPKDGEGNIFSLSVSSHLGGGAYLPSRQGGGTYLPRSGWGYPSSQVGGGGTYLSQAGGYLPFQVWMGMGVGTPLPRVGTLHPGQVPHLPRVGTPLSRVGTPPTQSRYPHLGQVSPTQGRYPHPGQVPLPRVGTPHPGQVPPTQSRYPPHPGQVSPHPGQVSPHPRVGTLPYRTSIACACYATGSMPLAFTQEDFLVLRNFILCNSSKKMRIICDGYLSLSLPFSCNPLLPLP